MILSRFLSFLLLVLVYFSSAGCAGATYDIAGPNSVRRAIDFDHETMIKVEGIDSLVVARILALNPKYSLRTTVDGKPLFLVLDK